MVRGAASSDEEAVDFFEPVVIGNQLTRQQSVSTPTQLTVKFDVTVEGNTMTCTTKANIPSDSRVYGSRPSAS